jgi:DNA-binding transcriptional LysR family regulator
MVMFELKHLRVFKEVAERGSFSAAAEELSYSQPAVSQQIAALERAAGAKLMDRTPRGIRLTDAGRALLRHAEAVLARLAEAEAELESIGAMRSGRVRLVSFPTGGSSLIPPATAAFHDRYPGVDLILSVAEPPVALDQLRSGNVDVALLLEPGFEVGSEDDGIERIHLLDDPMFLALPRDHPLAGRRRLKLAELADETWMHGSNEGCSCPDGMIFVRACHTAGFEPRVALHNDDYAAIQGFVAAGVGVALIPQLALESVRDDVVIRQLSEPKPIRRVVAAANGNGYRSPATEAMLEILREVSDGYLDESPPALAAVG